MTRRLNRVASQRLIDFEGCCDVAVTMFSDMSQRLIDFGGLLRQSCFSASSVTACRMTNHCQNPQGLVAEVFVKNILLHSMRVRAEF